MSCSGCFFRGSACVSDGCFLVPVKKKLCSSSIFFFFCHSLLPWGVCEEKSSLLSYDIFLLWISLCILSQSGFPSFLHFVFTPRRSQTQSSAQGFISVGVIDSLASPAGPRHPFMSFTHNNKHWPAQQSQASRAPSILLYEGPLLTISFILFCYIVFFFSFESLWCEREACDI